MENKCLNEQFARTEALIGPVALARLAQKRVCIFGVGGVGSFAVEALARAGVGAMDLVDRDVVDVTNINRQLIALHSTVGCPKVEVMRERILQINPMAAVGAEQAFVTPDWVQRTDFKKYDYVIDAVDNITAKLSICAAARSQGVPVISAMGAGNRLDPTAFRVADIAKTHGCRLARIMRRELKKRGITGVLTVFSPEAPAAANAELKNGRPLPASISYVPSVAGLILAGRVIAELAGLPVSSC